jgi:hypothetical protein
MKRVTTWLLARLWQRDFRLFGVFNGVHRGHWRCTKSLPWWIYRPMRRTAELLSERQTCPRRMREWGPWERKDGLDRWSLHYNGDRTCSFCGSWDPAQFIAFCDVIATAGTTAPGSVDYIRQKGKLYVHRPGIRNAGEGAIKFYCAHFSKEQMTPGVELTIDRARAVSHKEFERRMAAW